LGKGKLLVIGDLILDEYIVGEDYRMSDEAPVPIVKVDKFIPQLGGAANVANNIKALGGDVLLCGAIGVVDYGRSAVRFIEEMENSKLSTFYIVQGSMKTTTKSRVIIQDHQVVRFDYEDGYISQSIKEEIIEKIKYLDFRKIDLIVVSDYRKGVICAEVMDILISSGVKIVIDPKPKNKHLYYNTFCMTPNLKEFNVFTGSAFHKNNLDGIEDVSEKFRVDLSLDNLVVTLGEKGALCNVDGCCKIISSHKVEVANTIGAGDTFLSALCYQISEGKNILDAVKIANIAAAIAISKKYTGVCTIDEIEKYRNSFYER